ncbi:MAG: addiction module toxin, HicA family [Erysipelotrichia bacterium]|nr:addiction module toxin, HicA family [Erysipelotrichia bacterium]
MALLHNVTGNCLIRFIQSLGYSCERQNGSHKIFTHQQAKTITIPVYKKKIVKTGLLCGILKDIGISKTDFIQAIKTH